MNGPWHTPEHPDEADVSAAEQADETARLEAHAEAAVCDWPDCWCDVPHVECREVRAARASWNLEKDL